MYQLTDLVILLSTHGSLTTFSFSFQVPWRVTRHMMT